MNYGLPNIAMALSLPKNFQLRLSGDIAITI